MSRCCSCISVSWLRAMFFMLQKETQADSVFRSKVRNIHDKDERMTFLGFTQNDTWKCTESEGDDACCWFSDEKCGRMKIIVAVLQVKKTQIPFQHFSFSFFLTPSSPLDWHWWVSSVSLTRMITILMWSHSLLLHQLTPFFTRTAWTEAAGCLACPSSILLLSCYVLCLQNNRESFPLFLQIQWRR